MERYVWVFAGFPRNGLHAGGLQRAVEDVEELAFLEHDPAIQVRKEGVFTLGAGDERTGDLNIYLSPSVLASGITDEWFPENHSFGNGATIHKTTANYRLKTVVHGTALSMDEYLLRAGTPVALGDMLLERVHERTEGWDKYEARWLPGTCPQENHQVILTWLVTAHPLPAFALARVGELVEGQGEIDRTQYEKRHFSESRVWRAHEIPQPA